MKKCFPSGQRTEVGGPQLWMVFKSCTDFLIILNIFIVIKMIVGRKNNIPSKDEYAIATFDSNSDVKWIHNFSRDIVHLSYALDSIQPETNISTDIHCDLDISAVCRETLSLSYNFGNPKNMFTRIILFYSRTDQVVFILSKHLQVIKS